LQLSFVEKKLLSHKKFLLLLIIAPLAFFYWPSDLYGNSHYILLFGNSMLPTIQPGALVIAQAQPDYHEGEIIAFSDGHRNVVHRILEVTEDGYLPRGDNNPSYDDMQTYDTILGKVVLVLPYLAYLVLFLKTPIGLVMFSLISLVMLIPKSKSKKNSNTLNTRLISRSLFFAALGINATNYGLEQIMLSRGFELHIPFIISLHSAVSSTLLFGIWTIVLLALFLGMKYDGKIFAGLKIFSIILSLVSVLTIISKITGLIPKILTLIS